MNNLSLNPHCYFSPSLSLFFLKKKKKIKRRTRCYTVAIMRCAVSALQRPRALHFPSQIIHPIHLYHEFTSSCAFHPLLPPSKRRLRSWKKIDSNARPSLPTRNPNHQFQLNTWSPSPSEPHLAPCFPSSWKNNSSVAFSGNVILLIHRQFLLTSPNSNEHESKKKKKKKKEKETPRIIDHHEMFPPPSRYFLPIPENYPGHHPFSAQPRSKNKLNPHARAKGGILAPKKKKSKSKSTAKSGVCILHRPNCFFNASCNGDRPGRKAMM